MGDTLCPNQRKKGSLIGLTVGEKGWAFQLSRTVEREGALAFLGAPDASRALATC